MHVNEYPSGRILGCKFQAALQEGYVYAGSWRALRRRLAKLGYEIPEKPTMRVLWRIEDNKGAFVVYKDDNG